MAAAVFPQIPVLTAAPTRLFCCKRGGLWLLSLHLEPISHKHINTSGQISFRVGRFPGAFILHLKDGQPHPSDGRWCSFQRTRQFGKAAQGEIERPPLQGEQHPRPGCGTINDIIVTDQTQLEVQQIDTTFGSGGGGQGQGQ